MPSLLDRVSRFIDDVLLLPDDLRAQLEAAEDALELGRWEDARDRFREVAAERPTLARASVGVAQASEKLGQLEEARGALRTARDAAPDDSEVALYAGELALADRDWDEAAEAAREAASRLDESKASLLARACVVRARAEHGRGRPDRAARELRKALSVRPDDISLRVELIEALAATGRLSAARAAAWGVDLDEVPAGAAARVGAVLDDAGARDSARAWLERAAADGDPSAHRRLGRTALEASRLEVAEEHARLSASGGGGEASLVLVADVAVAQGRLIEAGEAFRAAARISETPIQWLRRSAQVADLADADALEASAKALSMVSASDPVLSAVRAWIALIEGDSDAALALAGESREPRAQLARAEARMRQGRPGEVLQVLSEWESDVDRSVEASVDRAKADQLRREALRALWRGTTGDLDLRAAIDAIEAFARDHGLPAAERDAARLRDELDRPLLLAVMGEFNAGKSTFINAFVGDDVAPTGIVPTTATLNVLRGGAERRVRILLRDGTTREGTYAELKTLLSEAGSDGLVDHVEIVLPAETLERIWILDTPGTNALDEDHERLAGEAARRADAVLWVFNAGQVGKDTEMRAIRRVRATGRPVFAVVNKADRLSTSELETVREALARDLPDFRHVAAISAKRALRARLDSDPEAYHASGFPDFLGWMDRDIVARSRPLKRHAIAGRLLAVLDAALEAERVAAEAFRDGVERLSAMHRRVAKLETPIRRAAEATIDQLKVEMGGAYVAAAREVLSFVKPRRHRFSRHGADREDRVFLADVMERQLGGVADAFERRLVARVRALCIEALDPESPEDSGAADFGASTVESQVRSAVRTPVAVWVGLQRGLLRGGGLERFFDKSLPELSLDEQAVADALALSGSDPVKDLWPSLTQALAELVSGMEEDCSRRLAERRKRHETQRRVVFVPLQALRDVLAGVGPVVRIAPSASADAREE